MDKLSIETPEQIQVVFSVAGVGSRFLAFLFDTLIQAIFFLVFYIAGIVLLAGTAEWWRGWELWVAAGFILIGFSVYVGYFAFFEIMWNGQTPGKRHFEIRVILDDGRPVPASGAITRNLLRLVDQLPFGYVVGIVCMLLNEKSKRLGDYVAGTVVVHEQSVEPIPLPVHPSDRPSSAARNVQLTPKEASVLETFISRAESLDPLLRANTAQELAARISARAGTPLPSGQDPEEYLRSIFAAGRRFTPH